MRGRTLIALLVALGLLCAPLSAWGDDATNHPTTNENSAESASVAPDDPDPVASGYFVPYLLHRGEVVVPEVVFGFHRHDAEKIRIQQRDLAACRGYLDDCTRLEAPSAQFRWGWLETAVGFAAGAALTVGIIYAVEAAR